MFDQIFDDQVVLDRIGVLEITDRVDPDCERNFPRIGGKPFDGIQRLRGKCLFVFGFEHEKEIVVLGIGILQIFEGLQLGVGVGKEHPVVSRKFEFGRAEAGTQRQHQRQGQHQPATRDDVAGQVCGEAIDRLEVVTHLCFSVQCLVINL